MRILYPIGRFSVVLAVILGTLGCGEGRPLAFDQPLPSDSVDDIDKNLRDPRSGIRTMTPAQFTRHLQTGDYLLSGTILLGAGVFTIDRTLHVEDGARIVGRGWRRTTIARDTAAGYFDMIVLEGAKDVSILRLAVDGAEWGDRARPEERFAGIRAYRPEGSGTDNRNLHIEDVECTRTTHGETQPEGVRACIVLEHTKHAVLRNLKVHGNLGSGVLIGTDSEDVLISGGRFYDNTFGSGITGRSYHRVRVETVEAYNNGYTNISMNGQDATVVDSLSYGSDFAGITLGHNNDGSEAHRARCENNLIYGNTLGGVYVSNSDDVVIRNNTIRDNVGPGINFKGVAPEVYQLQASGGATVSGNLIEGNGAAGILVDWGDFHRFIENAIEGNASAGIYLYGRHRRIQNIAVQRNELRHNGSSWTQAGVLLVHAHALVNKNLFVRDADAEPYGVLATEDAYGFYYSNDFEGIPEDEHYTALSGAVLDDRSEP